MPPPFNIPSSSPASSDLISAFPANEQANRAEIEEWLTFLSDPTTGIIKTTALPDEVTLLPEATSMLFVQTAAPTGWTKVTTHNNKALRIVSGTASSGGSLDFTTAFAANYETDDHTLTAAEIPNHAHTYSGVTADADANHTHSFTGTGTAASAGAHQHTITPGGTAGFQGGSNSGITTAGSSTGSAGAHTHSVSVSGTTGFMSANHGHNYSGTTASIGSSLGHSHTVDLNVAYVDVIIATKDA